MENGMDGAESDTSFASGGCSPQIRPDLLRTGMTRQSTFVSRVIRKCFVHQVRYPGRSRRVTACQEYL